MGDLETVIFRAGAVRDAAGTLRPGAVVVRNQCILAVDLPHRITIEDFKPAKVVDLPRSVILPAMVNAHAHLDLTELGPQSYPGDFIGWFNHILRGWPKLVAAQGGDEAAAVVRGVRRGAWLSRQAGIACVGDISDHPIAAPTLAQCGLTGIEFLELVGIGAERLAGSLAVLEQALRDLRQRGHPGSVRVGLQPHAPYSTGPDLYAAAVHAALEQDLRLCTHLAETPEELRFVAHAQGPFQELLVKMGRWREDYRRCYDHGRHPVEWLDRWLTPPLGRRWVLAHCNYLEDRHISALADAGASVAYCPIASEYFGHRDHHYRELLEAGVNVCLGTDSILCQPPDEPQPLGILPQMRRLHQRDRTDPATLLSMATVNGMKALGLPAEGSLLRPGAPARLIGVNFDPEDPADPLLQVLRNDYPVENLSITESRS